MSWKQFLQKLKLNNWEVEVVSEKPEPYVVDVPHVKHSLIHLKKK